MQRSQWATALVVTASLALAGCSSTPAASPSSGPSSAAAASAPASAAPQAAAANGRTITGKGYHYRVPKGWTVPKDATATATTDSAAIDSTDTDGFSDNVNVIVLNGRAGLAQAESEGPAGLKKAGATKVALRDRVSIAGTESAHVTALTSASGTAYRVDQFYAAHGGKTYVVTFSSSPDVSQSDRDAVSGSVLRTWAWA